MERDPPSPLAECGRRPTLPFGRVWKEPNLSLLAECGKSLISPLWQSVERDPPSLMAECGKRPTLTFGRVWKEPNLSLLAECGKRPTLPYGRVWKETHPPFWQSVERDLTPQVLPLPHKLLAPHTIHPHKHHFLHTHQHHKCIQLTGMPTT